MLTGQAPRSLTSALQPTPPCPLSTWHTLHVSPALTAGTRPWPGRGEKEPAQSDASCTSTSTTPAQLPQWEGHLGTNPGACRHCWQPGVSNVIQQHTRGVHSACQGLSKQRTELLWLVTSAGGSACDWLSLAADAATVLLSRHADGTTLACSMKRRTCSIKRRTKASRPCIQHRLASSSCHCAWAQPQQRAPELCQP